MKKRILPLLLALLMIIQLCPLTASAEESLSWIFTDEGYNKLLEDMRKIVWTNDSIKLTFYPTEGENHTQCYEQFSEVYERLGKIQNDLFLHTGNPVEGDYLKLSGNVYIDYRIINPDNGVYYEFTIFGESFLSQLEQLEMNNKVKQVMSSFGFTSTTSDYEKALAIYRYICDNVAYDHEAANLIGPSKSYTAYGALMNGKAICQGYAMLFYRLALEAGLDSRMINGYTVPGYHAWNIVRIEDVYYLLDSTWDEENAPENYRWFLKGSNTFPEHVAEDQALMDAYNISSVDYLPTPEHKHFFLISRVQTPTCDTEGLSSTKYCTICGYTERHLQVIPPLGHDYIQTERIAPTCTSDGIQYYICKRDSNHTYEKWLPAYPHMDLNADLSCDICNAVSCNDHFDLRTNPATPPTCNESGHTEEIYCASCNMVVSASSEIPALGHDYILSHTTPPSCYNCGMDTYVCSHDNTHTLNEISPTLEHIDLNFDSFCDNCNDPYTCFHEGEYLPEVPPTCTESGLTYGLICSKCGEWMTTRDEIPALGHSFANGICTVCGEEEASEPMENPFIDVKESNYFYNPVLWALQNNVTTGTSATTFGPDNPCTRGQTVMFLWRAAGSPAPTLTENPFEDVKESDYFYTAVLWAVEQGITKGTSATAFSPDAPCTRGQIATFLYSSQGKPITTGDSWFSDVSESDYYYTPILWAAQNNVTGGIGNGMFGPNQTCTRAHIVTFLYKIYG